MPKHRQLFQCCMALFIAVMAPPQDRTLGEGSRGEPGKDEGVRAGGEASIGEAGAGHGRRRMWQPSPSHDA